MNGVSMRQWASSGLDRDQIVLFPERLDEAVPDDHAVRLFDEVMRAIDWSKWEAAYQNTPEGRPPIHPRVLSSVILYGLLKRIRASRLLEDALWERLDFRWLAEDRKIDHTTICLFRRNHADELSDLFVQVALVAAQAQLSPLSRLAFDGTRIRANNHPYRTLKPKAIEQMRDELSARFTELEELAKAEDVADEERAALEEEIADNRRRTDRIQGALKELKKLKEAGKTPPKVIPLTDPESRIIPNKEGGFAANYTPLAGVDVDSGVILTGDVVPVNEEQFLVAAVNEVNENFETDVKEVLADGLFPTATNLQQLDDADVTLYSPLDKLDPKDNPAVRDDLTQATPAEDWDRLPTRKVKGGEQKLAKSAFIYDAEKDCYYCPAGKQLTRGKTTTDHRKTAVIKRTRYEAEAVDCDACPLRSRCLTEKAKARQVSRDQFEPLRDALNERMNSKEGKTLYAKRRSVGERQFGVIKQVFGARQFLLRGLARVRQEWTWLTTAYNLKKLLDGSQPRAGP